MTEPTGDAQNPNAAAPASSEPAKTMFGEPAKPAAATTPDSKSIMDGAVDEAGQAENKRLMEADDKTLSAEELAAKKVLMDAKAAEAAKNVPEKYEVKLPEGLDKDMTLLEKISPVFKELNITGEQAQKLVDVYAPHVKEQMANLEKTLKEQQEVNFQKFVESERKNTMEKLGATAKDELVFAAKSRDRFFSPETQELLNAAGIANNFSFISDLIRIGRHISEAKLVDGKGVKQHEKQSDGEILYGDTHKATKE
jgi:hypothetical protein